VEIEELKDKLEFQSKQGASKEKKLQELESNYNAALQSNKATIQELLQSIGAKDLRIQ